MSALTEAQPLIERYLEGLATAGEIARLEALIVEDEAVADAFALACELDCQLDAYFHDLAAERQETASLSQVAPSAPPAPSALASPSAPSSDSRSDPGASLLGMRPFWLGSVLVSAACLLACLYWTAPLWMLGDRQERPFDARGVLAKITHTVDAEWAVGAARGNGARLEAGTLRLERGVAVIEFSHGVVVSLEGPAVFDIQARDRTRLASGTLSARVPAGAEGFRVETSSLTVSDLGTEFGVRVGDDGRAEVSVFEGQVEVALAAHERVKQRLTAGQAVMASTKSTAISAVDFSTASYEVLWPVMSGIARSDGAFRIAPPGPIRLRLLQSNEDIFILPERSRVELRLPLRVDALRPGVYRRADQLSPSEIPRGTAVRSYLLQFNPVNSTTGADGGAPRRPGWRNPPERISGSITFDRPVLGLIVSNAGLAQTDARFARQPTVYPVKLRSLELNGGEAADSVTLSDDRRTVSLELAVFTGFADHVRVIVDDSHAPQVVTRREPSVLSSLHGVAHEPFMKNSG